MQSLVPALYPILKSSYGLSFSQVGLITLAFQCTASMLQPVVGLYTDRHPRPYSLTVGIGLTLVQRLVSLHNGTVSVSSDGPNCGSVFTVHLPRRPSPPQPAATDMSDSETSPRRIVIVTLAGILTISHRNIFLPFSLTILAFNTFKSRIFG